MSMGQAVVWAGPLGYREPALYAEFWKIVENYRVAVPCPDDATIVRRQSGLRDNITEIIERNAGLRLAEHHSTELAWAAAQLAMAAPMACRAATMALSISPAFSSLRASRRYFAPSRWVPSAAGRPIVSVVVTAAPSASTASCQTLAARPGPRCASAGPARCSRTHPTGPRAAGLR